jgi:uncharacterized protein YraI
MLHSLMALLVSGGSIIFPGVNLQAQSLHVEFSTYCPPSTEAACFATSTVNGLNPNGDGFLAVRTGPGSNYPMIDKLYNGDVVTVHDLSGRWRGVSYANGTRVGWVHSNWLVDLAG